MRRRLALLVLASALALVACITINVYFPEEAVKDLSEQIEQEVARAAGGAAAEPTPTPPAAGPAADPLATLLGLGAATAWAEEQVPEPAVSNPAIRRLIASRAARLEDIRRWKASGVLGESRAALLEVRSLEAVPGLKERAEVQRLVRDENADREQLFREVAAATDVALDQLDRIRSTYAETLRANSSPGDWVQLPDGTWVRKE